MIGPDHLERLGYSSLSDGLQIWLEREAIDSTIVLSLLRLLQAICVEDSFPKPTAVPGSAETGQLHRGIGVHLHPRICSGSERTDSFEQEQRFWLSMKPLNRTRYGLEMREACDATSSHAPCRLTQVSVIW